jgi:hypothetical protein
MSSISPWLDVAMRDTNNPSLPASAGMSEPAASMRGILDRIRATHAEHIWPEVSNPTAEQRAFMLHAVECSGLTVHDLGLAFAAEFQGRRLWCREHCGGTFTVEPVWSAADRRDIGRRFVFSDESDAERFRLTCS